MAINRGAQLQMKPMLQREAMPEEEELQMKSVAPGGIVEGDASPDLESEIQRARGGGQTLAPELQAKMGQAMGADFSGVRVHTNPQADHLNRSIQAKAFTTGQDIFFRQGAYQPGSRGGQELIAHELTHVVQQSEYATRPKSTKLQRDLEGIDPVTDTNVLDPNHVNDLLYGLANYRGATMARMAELPTQKRTVDQYNESVGIDGYIVSGRLASIGIYYIRNALEKPSNWRNYLPSTQFDYPTDAEILAYMQGGGALSNEQKWMTFLVREKRNIGLWDLGDTTRPVVGKNIFGFKKKGEEKGISRIKDKRRFEKNMHEDDAGTFTEKDVNKMLSFGIDIDAAQAYYRGLDDGKQQGLNRWLQNAFWRRTSKLGIDFATSDIGLNARVHFNLASGERQLGGGGRQSCGGY